MRYWVWVVMMVGMMSVGGCSGGGGSPVVSQQHQVLEALTANVIVPHLNAFLDQSVSLNAAVDAFVSSPTAVTLASAQERWKLTQEAWQKTGPFQLGPVKDQRLLSKINFWPKRPSAVDEVLNGMAGLTLIYVTELGATKKGLPVLEYLLFDPSHGSSPILTQFQSNPRRRLYVSLVSQELVNNARLLQQSWRSEGQDYGSSFVTSSDGLNMLVNQMVFLLEDIKNSKLGKPLGKSSGGTARPDEVESQQSEQSIAHMIDNIQGLSLFFDGESGKGMGDYIDFRGFASLRISINSQIQVVLTQLQALQVPLWQGVTRDTGALETLYTELTELLRWVKIDMATAINETVHFNDSDGD